MKLEGIILSEISQQRKTNNACITYRWNLKKKKKKGKLVDTESRIVIVRVGRGGK